MPYEWVDGQFVWYESSVGGSQLSSSSLEGMGDSMLHAPRVTNIRNTSSFGQYVATVTLDEQEPTEKPYDVVGGKRRFKVAWWVGGTDIRREVMMFEMTSIDIDFSYTSSQRSYIVTQAIGEESSSTSGYYYFDGYMPQRYAVYFNSCDGAIVTDVVVEGTTGGIVALDSELFLRDSEISLQEGYSEYVHEINSTVDESNVRKTIRS